MSPTTATRKTNERPGTRAQHRHARLSAYKARVVLDLIRGKTIGEADEILAFTERDAANVIRKVLDSAIANAEHNDDIPADELYVSACYADEGPTLKRWRPRARGRATRIRKRTCHITVIVSRLPADELARMRAREEAVREARSGQGSRASGAAQGAAEARRRRVAKSRQAKAEREHEHDHDHDDEIVDEVEADLEAEAALEAETPVAGEVEVEAAEADEVADPEADDADTETEASAEADSDEAAADEDGTEAEEKNE